jgi:hypothetical protein
MRIIAGGTRVGLAVVLHSIGRYVSFLVTVWSNRGSTCVQSMVVSIRHYNPVIVSLDGCVCPLWLKHDSFMVSKDAVTTSHKFRQV